MTAATDEPDAAPVARCLAGDASGQLRQTTGATGARTFRIGLEVKL
jgi:hypothetical protein